MNLTLTNEESAELARLLASALSDLNMEIADTDNPIFKASLRQRRERLRTVHSKLGSAAA